MTLTPKQLRKGFISVYEGAAAAMVGEYLANWNEDQRRWRENTIERTQGFRPVYRINLRRKAPVVNENQRYAKPKNREEGAANLRAHYQEEGRMAFRRGMGIDFCPYTTAAPPCRTFGVQSAVEWIRGWKEEEAHAQ